MPSWPIIVNVQLAFDRSNRATTVDFTPLEAAAPIDNLRTGVLCLLAYFEEQDYRNHEKRVRRHEIIRELEDIWRWILDGQLTTWNMRLNHYGQLRNDWEMLTGLIETTQIFNCLGREDWAYQGRLTNERGKL